MIKYACEYPCQYRHAHTCMPHTYGRSVTPRSITPSHTCSHTLPPLLPWPHTPSHPRSLTHPSDVSWSKMPAGSTLIALFCRRRTLGTRRGGSQPSHTPPAHARCVGQHAHACAPCTCAVHMHVRTVALSLSFSLWICAHRACLCALMHTHIH